MIEIKPLASGSSGNLYRVNDGNTALLLEAGIKLTDIRKGLDFKLSQIAGCLISHEHQDHSRAAVSMMKMGIDIYLSQGTLHALGLNGHRVNIIKARKQLNIGDWAVLPFEIQHDANEPLGFLLASGEYKILYATDTPYLKYRFNGLSHIAIECNYSKRILSQNRSIPSLQKQSIIRNHFSLENVKELLKANDLSKVEEIYLLHLSDANSNAEMFKREIQQLTGKPTFIAHTGRQARSEADPDKQSPGNAGNR